MAVKLSEAARAERNRYYAEWRKRNREKTAAYDAARWERKAAERRAAEQAADHDNAKAC